MKPDEPKTKPQPSPLERTRALALQAMAVPKSEVDRREQEWREQRASEKKLKTQ